MAKKNISISAQVLEQEFYIIGTAPLIQHRFSKADDILKEHLHMGKGERMKPPRDLIQEVINAIYFDETDTVSILALAIKGSMIGACTATGIYPGSRAKSFIRVLGSESHEFSNLYGLFDTVRVDRVVNENGTLDIRVRPQFWPWGCSFQVRSLMPPLSPDMLAQIVFYAGEIGIGDWRGNFGQFKPVTEAEFQKFTQQFSTLKREDVYDKVSKFVEELEEKIA